MNPLTNAKTWIAGGLAAVVLAVGGCTAAAVATTTTSTSTSTTTGSSATVALTADHDDTSDHTWDADAEVAIDLSNPTATAGVTVKDGVITVTAAGAYRLSGTLADGQVVVDTTGLADSIERYADDPDAPWGGATAMLLAESVRQALASVGRAALQVCSPPVETPTAKSMGCRFGVGSLGLLLDLRLISIGNERYAVSARSMNEGNG